jgi:Leucine-rich repeat (LRR) protein
VYENSVPLKSFFSVISDNFISELKREDLHSLGLSLKVLDLSGNCLTSVPEAIFWDLQRLESLDLSRNNIIQIHSMAFQNGVSFVYHT